jgi:hypothetical protein
MIFGKKHSQKGVQLFKRAYHNAPSFFSKVGNVSEQIAKGAVLGSAFIPELAPILTGISGVAEGVSAGSKAISSALEKTRDPHNRLHGRM